MQQNRNEAKAQKLMKLLCSKGLWKYTICFLFSKYDIKRRGGGSIVSL